MDVKDLKVAVAGIARSGSSAALFLKKKGASVYATDSADTEEIRSSAGYLKKKGIEVEIGGHTERFVKKKDLLVVSPGVPSESSVISWAKNYSIPVISELELAFRFSKGKIIAITGTNGKTTTTALVGHILKKSGKQVTVCGNIGTPFIGEVERLTDEHYVVLEVSSFQLEWIDAFRPHVSVILNITDDHMDRHRDFNEYVRLKKKIFLNQKKGDFIILNYEDHSLRSAGNTKASLLYFSQKRSIEGVFKRDKDIVLNKDGASHKILSRDSIKLKGLHNLDNVIASVLACKSVGLGDEEIIRGISSFTAPPHRFQSVLKKDGVEYIDDSKATNVDAACKALLSLNGGVVLIAGGRDKDSDFSIIKDVVGEKVHTLVLIGEASEKMADSFGGLTSIHRVGSMEEAVTRASDCARKGDTVLLSPMCASFDMFRDYAHRGDCFRNAVMRLGEKAHKVRVR